GIIRALFGGNNDGQGGAFYLSDDDAKTMGDIEYMRSNKVVRRTFAKKKGEIGEKASTKSVSAMKSSSLGENGLLATPPASSTSSQSGTAAQSSAPTKRVERRSASVDSSMDMFRNMAKQIRK
ncbi:MAG: hypothetical protein AAF152_06235, partial [Cyanobacteria bacterium P01_A01_bin.114]